MSLTRQQLIDHIMFMKSKDEDYARYALARLNQSMPWLDLNNGIKEALKAKA